MDRLRELAKAATPGPWHAQGGPQTGVDYVVGPTPDDFLTGPLRHANAAFIAAANPDTVLRLLDVVEAARNLCDQWGQPDLLSEARRIFEARDTLRAALERLGS